MQTITQSTTNKVIFYANTTITDPAFLLVAKHKCSNDERAFNAANLAMDGCGRLEFDIVEVSPSGTEDLDNATVILSQPGSWDISVYEQATGSTNKDPDLATFLIEEEMRVIGSDVCNIPLPPPPPTDCDDATVRNSDSTYTDTVASGAILVLPDITHTDSDGVTPVTLPAQTPFVATVCTDDSTIVFDYPVGAEVDNTFTLTATQAGSYVLNTLVNVTSFIFNINAGPDITVVSGGSPLVLASSDTLRVRPTITNDTLVASMTLTT